MSIDLYSYLRKAETTRFVYFAFHYQRDIWRVQQVKNHWVTKESHKAAGFFDGSLEEKAKTDGDAVVKRLINKGMVGASVTCVLIGAETYNRRWVQYEIFNSIEQGMGVFGVRIHGLKNGDGKTDAFGSDPFYSLGYAGKNDKLYPQILYTNGGWTDSALNGSISASAAPYLKSGGGFKLDSIFKVYDWTAGNGFDNFSDWVDAAAKQAGR
jgi:hypothetical protein